MENIGTNRLTLRKFRYDDIDSMLKNWIADPIIQKGYGEPVYETKESVKNLINVWNEQLFRFAIILNENMECIGQVSFCRIYSDEKTGEIEYCIGQKYWGNGYATEAVITFIDFVFNNSELEKIEAFHRVDNPVSGKVLQKAGMIIVPNIIRFETEGKIPEKEICYAIIKYKEKKNDKRSKY